MSRRLALTGRPTAAPTGDSRCPVRRHRRGRPIRHGRARPRWFAETSKDGRMAGQGAQAVCRRPSPACATSAPARPPSRHAAIRCARTQRRLPGKILSSGRTSIPETGAAHSPASPASAVSGLGRQRHNRTATKCARTPRQLFVTIRSGRMSCRSPGSRRPTGGDFPAYRHRHPTKLRTETRRGSTRGTIRRRAASRTTTVFGALLRSRRRSLLRRARSASTTTPGARPRATMETLRGGTAFNRSEKLQRSAAAVDFTTADRRTADIRSPGMRAVQATTAPALTHARRCS